MIQLISWVNDGKVVFQYLTGYGATNGYPTQNAARRAALQLIREAQ